MLNFDRQNLLKRLIALGNSGTYTGPSSLSSADQGPSSSTKSFLQRDTFVSLEQRVLFDASLGDAISDTSAEYDADTQAVDDPAALDVFVDPVIDAIIGDSVTFGTSHKTIVFVDAAVSDISVFLALDDPDIEFYSIVDGANPFNQIASILAGRDDLNAIHILSHGNSGVLQLGGVDISSSELSEFGAELATIGDSLSAGGDILIYGCNIAEGDNGRQFLQAMSFLTGADVAGSHDLTGDVGLGGDWELEEATGQIETAALFEQIDHVGFDSLLAAPTISGPAAVNLFEDDTITFNTSGIPSIQEITISDADSDPVSVRLSVTNGTISTVAGAGVSGIGTSVIEISSSPLNSMNSVLATLVYTPNGDFNGSDSLVIAADDGSTVTLSSVAISVAATNDAPTVSVPPAIITLPVDTPFQVPGIVVDDIDVNNGLLTVDLWVTDGAISLETDNVTVLVSTPAGDHITINGTVDALNASLATMVYTPFTGYTGIDTINIFVDDNGNNGVGGNQITPQTVTLNVIDVTAGLTVTDENAVVGAYTGITADFPDIVVDDTGNGLAPVKLTLSVTNGTLHSDYISSGGLFLAGGNLVTGNVAGASFYVVYAQIDQINSVLEDLTYTSDPDFTGTDTFSVVVMDTSNPFTPPKLAFEFMDVIVRNPDEIGNNIGGLLEPTPLFEAGNKNEDISAPQIAPRSSLTMANVLSGKDRELFDGALASALARGEMPSADLFKQFSLREALGDEPDEEKLFPDSRNDAELRHAAEPNTEENAVQDNPANPEKTQQDQPGVGEGGTRPDGQPDDFDQGVERIIQDFSGPADNDGGQ